jgi:arginase
MCPIPSPHFTTLEAPSVLGLFPQGVERLPAALLAAGLRQHLHAGHSGRVEPPPYNPIRDPISGLLNPEGLARYTVALANQIGRLLDANNFPVVLGGDCSILLGAELALRRRGRYGLLFLDGHADFYQPEAEPNGEAASMELALATGRGPPLITDLEGRRPLLLEEDVVVFGRRDAADAESHGSQRIEDTAIRVLDLEEVRRAGIRHAMGEALDILTRPDLAGFWLHLDCDVLDDAIMPAVDYRMPGGLSWDELVTVLNLALGSGRTVGIDITIMNPALDRNGALAGDLVEALGKGLCGLDGNIVGPSGTGLTSQP